MMPALAPLDKGPIPTLGFPSPPTAATRLVVGVAGENVNGDSSENSFWWGSSWKRRLAGEEEELGRR